MGQKLGKARFLFTVIDYFFLGYFYMVRGLARILPPRLLYALFRGFGYALYYLIPGARKRVCSNVREAMPEITDPKIIKRIARKGQGELFLDMPDLAVFARHKEQMWSKMTVDGLEEIDKELEKGNGGICICAHIGAWAIAMGLMGGYGYASTPILMHPERTLTPRLVKAVEDYADSIDASDSYILTGEGSIEQTRECLKQSKIVVITVDVVGSRVVNFFGHPTSLSSGIGHFICETGAPMAAGLCLRTKDPLKIHIIFGKPIEYELTGDRDADVQSIMQASAKAIEEQLRSVPEQWTQWGALGTWWKKAEKLESSSESNQL